MLSLSVQGRCAGLLSQIEQDVLDDGKPIGSALRRCMLLGSRTGSSQLREWATLELKGYPVPVEVPDYRVITEEASAAGNLLTQPAKHANRR